MQQAQLQAIAPNNSVAVPWQHARRRGAWLNIGPGPFGLCVHEMLLKAPSTSSSMQGSS